MYVSPASQIVIDGVPRIPEHNLGESVWAVTIKQQSLVLLIQHPMPEIGCAVIYVDLALRVWCGEVAGELVVVRAVQSVDGGRAAHWGLGREKSTTFYSILYKLKYKTISMYVCVLRGPWQITLKGSICTKFHWVTICLSAVMLLAIYIYIALGHLYNLTCEKHRNCL